MVGRVAYDRSVLLGQRGRRSTRALGAIACALVLACGQAEVEPVPVPAAEPPDPEPPAQPRFDVGSMPVVPDDPEAARRLAARLAEPEAPGLPLQSAGEVLRFYAERDHQPAWTRRGRPTAEAIDTLRALSRLHEHGLDPRRYHREAMAFEGPVPEDPLELELRLTDAWLTAGAHLLHGRVDPVKIHPAWSAPARSLDRVAALERALSEGAPGEALLALAPPHPEYAALVDALRELEAQREQGAWPRLPRAALPLVEGSTGPAVAALRTRLARTDGLADPSGDAFDAELAAAVRRFQARHGIEVTGEVDAVTRRDLDVSIDDRIAQLHANLERWRWLPEDLGDRHVRVNIAAFEVTLVEAGKHVLTMKAVVGKRYRKTPVFSTTITAVTINPRWMVPPKLAVQDLLPEIKRDRSTIERKRLRVIDARTGAVVDPGDVPWERLSARRFPYLLRQDPGPDNALGRFKLVMPNDYDVYLHDTPKRHLFSEDRRDRSSGCVRIQHPRDLSVALLAGHPKWTPTRLDAAVAMGRELTIRLPKPVPVHILYWTAFVDEEGQLQLRRDVYERDRALIAALAEADGQR